MMLRRESVRCGRAPRGSARSNFSITVSASTAPARASGLDTLLASEFEEGPRDDDDRDGHQHHRRGGKALTEVLRAEHVLVDVFRRHLGGRPGATAGHCDHKVVELDDAAHHDDERGYE